MGGFLCNSKGMVWQTESMQNMDVYKFCMTQHVSLVKITANNDFKMVPDKIAGVTATSTPVIPGVRCLRRAFCSALWHFAMQRYVTIKRFVPLQNYS